MFELSFEKWNDYLQSLPIESLFVTVSGAHVYGFPSPDSDIDLRGCHQLPLEKVVGLTMPNETFELNSFHDEIEVDVVSHEVGKYLRLLVTNNGYVLEQIFSPMVVCGAEFLERLRPTARRCVTRYHYHHYRGFYQSQLRLLEKQPAKRIKSLLYAYRVLLTGIYLLRTGEVELNVVQLADELQLPYIGDLVAMKTEEKIESPELDWEYYRQDLASLEGRLDSEFEKSRLPEDRDRAAVNQLLVDLRLQ